MCSVPVTLRLLWSLCGCQGGVCVGGGGGEGGGRRSRGWPSRRWQGDIVKKEGTTWNRTAWHRQTDNNGRHWWRAAYTLQWMGEAELKIGGRNSSVGSVLGSLSCLMQRRGFDPPLRRFFFPWSYHGLCLQPPPPPTSPLPPKKSLDESINRGLVCAHMHSITRIQKILTVMS